MKIAVQHENILDEDPVKSTSYTLCTAALSRGWQVFTYAPKTLSLNEAGTLTAELAPVLADTKTPHRFIVGDRGLAQLNDFDAIFNRTQPPFDQYYFQCCRLLEHIHPEPYVVNNPRAVRNFIDKLMPFELPQYMPPTLISDDSKTASSFLDEHKDIVIKPLDLYAGKDIVRLQAESSDKQKILEKLFNQRREKWMVQKFLPEIKTDGDTRVLLTQQEILFAYVRFPKKGGFIANFSAGGTTQETTLSPTQQKICEDVRQLLLKHDVLFAGVDLIGPYLTEINITSPACRGYGQEDGSLEIEQHILDLVENKVGAMS